MFLFFLFSILNVSLNLKIKNKSNPIFPPTFVQNVDSPIGPSPTMFYQQRNINSNPLSPLGIIQVGGNNAMGNPLISESNRRMLQDFDKGSKNFKEEPILANNKLNVALLNQYSPAMPSNMMSNTISTNAPLGNNQIISASKYSDPIILN